MNPERSVPDTEPASAVPPGAELDDHRLAAQVATEAGQLLLAVRRELSGADPKVLRDEGDRRSHERICSLLARARPGDAILSEEAADDAVRLSSARVWIVDPLDGTREFAEPPRDDWAVHVALWARRAPGAPTPNGALPGGNAGSSALDGSGGSLVAGAVALPGMGATLATDRPPKLPPPDGGPLRLVASRTRPPALVESLMASTAAVLVPMGSAGAKAMAVVRGEADAYVHAGGQYEWDSAAPAAVAAACGLHTSRLDGTPLRYNRPDPLLPDLIICRPELAGHLLEAIASAAAAPN